MQHAYPQLGVLLPLRAPLHPSVPIRSDHPRTLGQLLCSGTRPDSNMGEQPVHRSTSFVRRACAVGTATALIGLTTGLGVMTATTAYAAEAPTTDTSVTAPGADATPGTDATTAPAEPTTPAEPSLPTDGATSAPGATTS